MSLILGWFPGEENDNPLHILAWKMPWKEEPGGLQSIGSQRVRHDLATEQQHSIENCRYWHRLEKCLMSEGYRTQDKRIGREFESLNSIANISKYIEMKKTVVSSKGLIPKGCTDLLHIKWSSCFVPRVNDFEMILGEKFVAMSNWLIMVQYSKEPSLWHGMSQTASNPAEKLRMERKTYSLIQFEFNLRCFSGILLSYQYQLYLPVILSIKLVGIFSCVFFFLNFIIASSYL